MSRYFNILSNTILMCTSTFFIFALIYTIIRSEFYPSETMTKFYIIFTISIILCVFSMRLNLYYKTGFILLMLSTFFTVYLTEVYLSCCTNINSMNLPVQAASATGRPFDSRTRYQAYLDFVEEGNDIYPSLSAAQFLGENGPERDANKLLPLAGISKKTTLFCNESGEYITYQSDEHGFNNPTGLYRAGHIDIALIGDSFTHGACVAPGEDIASRLRSTGKTIINLGYNGNGPLIKLATIKEYAELLRPKIVLWIYYEGNDLIDLSMEQQSPDLLSYLNRDHSQNLYKRQSEVDIFLIYYLNEKIEKFNKKSKEDIQFANHSQLSKTIRLYHLRTILRRVFSSPPPIPLPSPLFANILKEAKERTSAWGGTLHFVYLPAWQRYGTKANHGKLFHRDQVLSIVSHLEIPIIDVHDAFAQHPEPLSLFPFKLPGHYVAKGYEMVAAVIQTYLEGNRVAEGIRQPQPNRMRTVFTESNQD